MKLILLSGKPQTQKTTTLNLLYDEIIKNGGNVLVPKKQVGGNKNDFTCVLKYKSKKIVIYTMGDYLWGCVETIIEYSNVDILIMAYSDKFSYNLSSIVSKYNHHSIVHKTNFNIKDCGKIMNIL
jgi:hypothetical protein